MAWYSGVTNNVLTRNIGKGADAVGSGLSSAASGVAAAGGAIGDLGGSVWGSGKDVMRDVPVVGDILGLSSSADQAADAQRDSLRNAQNYQERMYGEAQGHLSPYSDVGGKYLSSVADGIDKGMFSPQAMAYKGEPQSFQYNQGMSDFASSGQGPQGFNYQGQGPQGFNYQGDLPSDFQYSSQRPRFDYQGGPLGAASEGMPEDRSIASFMGNVEDTPGYQFQLEQGQKAIDRASAASGRFGGGRAAQELLRQGQGLASQAYGDEFNRAAQERAGAIGAEQQRYGRGLTAQEQMRMQEQESYGRGLSAFDRAIMGEESDYQRRVGEYGMGRDLESERRQRALEDYGLSSQLEGTQYQRQLGEYGLGRELERDKYGREVDEYGMASNLDNQRYQRSLGQYGLGRDVEQERYQRALTDYSLDAEAKQNLLNQQMGMINIGQQASTALSNAATGHGSTLADLSIQQGNVAAAQKMAGANQLGSILDLAGKGMSAYGQYKEL